MRIFLTTAVSLAAALLAAPTSAQKMGSKNRDAPKVTQSIAFANGSKIEISYFAIAQGAYLDNMLKADGKSYRTRFNSMAERAPLGKLSVSKDTMIGGHKVAAGDYKLSFTISEEMKFSMSLTPKSGDAVKLPVDTGEAASKTARMSIQLTPAEDAKHATLAVVYGKLNCSFAVGGNAESGKDGASHDGAGQGKGARSRR